MLSNRECFDNQENKKWTLFHNKTLWFPFSWCAAVRTFNKRITSVSFLNPKQAQKLSEGQIIFHVYPGFKGWRCYLVRTHLQRNVHAKWLMYWCYVWLCYLLNLWLSGSLWNLRKCFSTIIFKSVVYKQAEFNYNL